MSHQEIVLPELGEGIESGNILDFLAEVGQEITEEQGLIEIETDKATIEMPSPISGKLVEFKVKQGDEIQVGQVVAIIETQGTKNSELDNPVVDTTSVVSETSEIPESKASNSKSETMPVTVAAKVEAIEQEITVPELGEGVTSGSVLDFLVEVGQEITEEQGLIEIETDKATIEMPSPMNGQVVAFKVNQGDEIQVGQVVAIIKSVGSVVNTPTQNSKSTPSPIALSQPVAVSSKESKEEPKVNLTTPVNSSLPLIRDSKIIPASPSVRYFAFEIGIDLTQVKGTGYGGRISIDDIKQFSKVLNKKRGNHLSQEPAKSKVILPDFSKFGTVEAQKMSRIRQVTAKHMALCWDTIPHVTQFDKANITELEVWRKSQKAKVEEQGAKLTITSMLVQALVRGLKQFPDFNTSIDIENQKIIYKKYYNVGIAVDTPNGLLVPVIKKADQQNLTGISISLTEISTKARDRKITPNDLQGSCMTITNLGGIGGTAFTPIVNSPEVAILGVSRGTFEPIYNPNTKEFEPKLMMPLSLSYDHRVIDGALAAKFLRFICENLESSNNFCL